MITAAGVGATRVRLPHPRRPGSSGAPDSLPAATRLHRRQYVVGPRPVLDWPYVRVAPGLVLSRHPELRCEQVPSPSGVWTLLGSPVQTDDGAGTPAEQLRSVDPRAPQATTRSWAGRWLLLDPYGRVHLDASGLLGCVYRTAAGSTWASSSPALLAALPGLARLPRTERVFGYAGANWHASPGAGHLGMDRLLPSQVLDVATGRVSPRRLMSPQPPRPADDVAAEIGARMATGLEHLATGPGRVWLALTAGIDSRTLLSAAVARGVPVSTFTQLHDEMSLADRVLPPRLAAAAGVPHRFVAPQALRDDRLALYDAHTGGAAQDRDRDFYPRGQWDHVEPGDVVLRANAFEVLASSWQRRVRADDLVPQAPSVDAVLRLLKEAHGGDTERSIRRWLAWTGTSPEPDLLWVDRLYWEQRLGAWAATTEQSLDLLEGTSVVLPNCLAVFQALSALPQPVRRGRQAQRALVAAHAPALAAFPVNPARGQFPVASRVRHAVRRGPWGSTQAAVRSLGRRQAAAGHVHQPRTPG